MKISLGQTLHKQTIRKVYIFLSRGAGPNIFTQKTFFFISFFKGEGTQLFVGQTNAID